jgi:hypothetical protein
MTFFSIRPLAGAGVLVALAAVAAPSAATTTTTTTTTSSITVSTAFVSTSSSMLEEYDNDREFTVYPAQPIASLTVHVKAYPDYGPDDASCVFYGPGSAVTGFRGETTFTFASLPKGELDRSQALFNCSYYTHEPHGSLGLDDIQIVKYEARNSEGKLVDLESCITEISDDAIPLPGPGDCRNACGDAICDGGEPTAADALGVLKRALGFFFCRMSICDTNHDGEVTTTDALKVLRRAVSLRSVLLCPVYECG